MNLDFCKKRCYNTENAMQTSADTKRGNQQELFYNIYKRGGNHDHKKILRV